MDDEIPEEFRRCVTSKMKFASAADARKFWKDPRSGGKRMYGTPRAYRCWHCDWFHIASGRSNR